jgi:hypothetical protein
MLSRRESHSCGEQQPTTSTANDVDGINKQSSSSRALTAEITEGNCLIGDKGERLTGADEKINTPKKRFFDLKRTAESAASKIKSPSRFSLNNLTPRLRRKSAAAAAANHKLSQLEQHSNLFIRERGSEEKTNSTSSTETVAMENGAVANAENQQTTISGGGKLNKVSLVPSFISPSRKLCKNLPKTPLEFPNYEEIDIGGGDNNQHGDETLAVAEVNSIETFTEDNGQEEEEEEEAEEGAMSKADLNVADMLKNIPVRQRKSVVPHMENYCLFDPAVDFCNEKELRRNNFALQSAADFPFPIANFSHLPRVVHYDISEHDERSLPFHNYYEIDPELLEKDEAMAVKGEVTRQSSDSSSSSGDYPHEINAINHANADNLITSGATGARRKFQPQLERIARKEVTCMSANNSPRKINLQLDPLKASHSLPQLEQIEVAECPPKAIQMRKMRPLSSDSGFTTPSPPNEHSNNQVNNSNVVKEAGGGGGVSGGGGKNESTVLLNQCDNIQQLIEVSNGGASLL